MFSIYNNFCTSNRTKSTLFFIRTKFISMQAKLKPLFGISFCILQVFPTDSLAKSISLCFVAVATVFASHMAFIF